MTAHEKMIHIRLDSDVHRDLRRAAAEEDTSIQELVSRVVSRTVEGGRLVEVVCTSEVEAGDSEMITLQIEEGAAGSETIMERMERILDQLQTLEEEVKELKKALTRDA